MTAELTPRQARFAYLATEYHNLETEVVDDQGVGIVYLLISNPRRPYAGRISVAAWTSSVTGRVNHTAAEAFQATSRKLPLRHVATALSCMADL